MASEVALVGELMALKAAPEVDQWSKEIALIARESDSIKINSDEAERTAAEMLQQIALRTKELERRRKEITDPHEQYKKRVIAFFGDILNPLDKAKRLLNQKVLAWRHEKEIAARKAQERADREAAKLAAKMEKAGIDPGTVAPQVIAQPVQRVTRTELGSTYEKKEWVFEVVDVVALARAVIDGKIQAQAITVNETFIRSLVRGGVRQIDGIRIFEQKSLVTRAA